MYTSPSEGAMVKLWTAQTLRRRRSLAKSQTCDLKIDTGHVRVWLSRCGVEDGEPYENKVTIECLVDGRWIVTDEYEG